MKLERLNRLKIKSINLFFGLFVLVVLSAVAFEGYYSYRYEIERTSKYNEIFTEAVEQHLVGIVNKLDLLLTQMKSRIPTRAPPDSQTINSLIDYVQVISQDYPELDTVGITDAQGINYANSTFATYGPNRLIDLSDRLYFQHLKTHTKNEIYISEPFHSKATADPVVNISRRLNNDEKDNFAGVVFTTINLKKLSEIFSYSKIGEDGTIDILSPELKLIAHYPVKETLLCESNPTLPQLNHLLSLGQAEGTYEAPSPIDNIDRLYSFKKISKYHFTIVIGQSKEIILKSWGHHLELNFLISMSLLFISGIAFFWFQNNMNRRELERMTIINSSKMSALGEMAGGVAHEINNPLTIINGYAEFIIRVAVPGHENLETLATIAAKAEKIRASVERIAKIVRGLKNFSRNGERDPLSEISVLQLITHALDLTHEKFKSQGVELFTDVPQDIMINCREIQLEQVLINLLNNSFDAVIDRPEKWVRIQTRTTNKGRLQILVTDSGDPIPQGIKDKIMQPFFTTKEIGKGTGLGLSISQGIIEDHGGHLRLDNTAINTCFVIELPIHRMAEALPITKKAG